MDRDDVFTFQTLGDVIDGVVRDLELRTQDRGNKRPRIVETPGKYETGRVLFPASGGRGEVPGARGGRNAPGTARHRVGASVTKGNRRL